jgi:hypothetical protein
MQVISLLRFIFTFYYIAAKSVSIKIPKAHIKANRPQCDGGQIQGASGGDFPIVCCFLVVIVIGIIALIIIWDPITSFLKNLFAP